MICNKCGSKFKKAGGSYTKHIKKCNPIDNQQLVATTITKVTCKYCLNSYVSNNIIKHITTCKSKIIEERDQTIEDLRKQLSRFSLFGLLNKLM